MADPTLDDLLREVLPPLMYGKIGLDGIRRDFDNNEGKRTKVRQLIESRYMPKPKDTGLISDGYHTFNELYDFRLLYNAAFFNWIARVPQANVHKSRLHSDGEEPFGGGWFIVMAKLPSGQISNHYEIREWDLFKIPEHDRADAWDGHTPQGVAARMREYLTGKKGE